MSKEITIALAGNPNCGKTTIFNLLTGLHQRTGNYPGLTVEKVSGKANIANKTYRVIDLPGLYSLNPSSPDEVIAADLIKGEAGIQADLFIYVADASNMRRSLYLFCQLQEAGFPLILLINMADVAAKKGFEVDTFKLEEILEVPVIEFNALRKESLNRLKASIMGYKLSERPAPKAPSDAKQIYSKVDSLIAQSVRQISAGKTGFSDKLDNLVLHPFWGFIIFFALLFLMFQAVFTLASYPMGWIEEAFIALESLLTAILPPRWLTYLLTEGILAGLAGVVIFVPQIAFLFLFLTFFEETGYMARVAFMMDNLMRRLGMHGRSVMPLVGGAACAIPAIMATRTINNPRSRLITMLVIPLMTCSARLPIFILLISILIPANYVWGVFNLQALTMAGLYFGGILASLFAAMVFDKILPKAKEGFFVMDMPGYKMPQWRNLLYGIYSRCMAFVLGAGKIILMVSIVLWFLASFGPSPQEGDAITYQVPIEESYAGIMGKAIEPAIKPLGYDWKIGIAIITSFAAREVFVGTLSTIYSVDEETGQGNRLKEKLLKEKDSSGSYVFNRATVISLLLFYFFALQCMSTLAVLKKETGGWKWPVIQFIAFGAAAYLSAFAAYRLLS